jgi:hypothetical protein
MNAQAFGPKHPAAAHGSVFDGSPLRIVLFVVLGIGLYVGGALSVSPRIVSEDAVKAALAEHLPDLNVTAINCRTEPGRCEVVAGELVFMTDYAGKTIFLGQRLEPQIAPTNSVNTDRALKVLRDRFESQRTQSREKAVIPQGVEQ